MLRSLKKRLYFQVAGYFRFFAAIQLRRWKPHVVVVTGSNGKTTTLHMLQAQLGGAARYSHHANSAFGIPFDILGLKRGTYSPLEWLGLFAAAPLRAYKRPFKEAIYVAEADCDRPGEGEFLSALLRPEITVWLSSARTHSQNFDRLVTKGAFKTVDEAIAAEFGWFLKRTTGLGIYNGDAPLIKAKASAKTYAISEAMLTDYAVSKEGTLFKTAGQEYRLPFLLPKETFYSVAAAIKVADYFSLKPKASFPGLVLPPGRSSLFKGIKDTVILDSSYNANLASVAAILALAKQLPGPQWAVIGDLVEQGAEEQEEHEKLAELLAAERFERIILVGPRLAKYALPRLKERSGVTSFIYPKEALEAIASTLQGGETLVVKGARFLEGVVEHLLADSGDVAKLCRQEPLWKARRKEWGL